MLGIGPHLPEVVLDKWSAQSARLDELRACFMYIKFSVEGVDRVNDLPLPPLLGRVLAPLVMQDIQAKYPNDEMLGSMKRLLRRLHSLYKWNKVI